MIMIFMAQLHPTGDLNLDKSSKCWRIRPSSTDGLLLLVTQGPDRNFLEEDHIVLTVILQPKIAFEGPRTMLRLEAEFRGGTGWPSV